MDNIVLLLLFALSLRLYSFFTIANTCYVPCRKPFLLLINTPTRRSKYGKINLHPVPVQADSQHVASFVSGKRSQNSATHHTVTGKLSKIHHKLSIVRDSCERVPSKGSQICH